ncbi:N-acetylmuramoyl-L-alanine amidase family protein [Wenyingzhuangia sp. IMCC45574]
MKIIHFPKYTKFYLLLCNVLIFCSISLCSLEAYAQNKPFLVVLDAGHGGKDPGKIGYKGAKEKDVALNIVLKTGKILEKIPGVKVMYTRKRDVFVNLWKRGDIANEADADLFVSVHCNAHTSQAIGSETWVLGVHANERNFRVAKAENEVILQEEGHKERYQGFDPKSPTSVIGLSLEQEEYLDQSLLLASLIQEEFEKKLKRVNRGVKQAGFVVLYQTYMPSVLIETGFLTNRIEGKYLYSKQGQEQMSKAIANSIQDYYKVQQLNVADSDFLIENKTIAIESAPANDIVEEVYVGEDDNNYFKVQLASGKKKVKTFSRNFKGLKNVERIKVDGGYKYYLSKYLSRSQANLALQLAKKKGYASAFVVAFNADGTIFNGKKEIKKVVPPKETVKEIQKEEVATVVSTPKPTEQNKYYKVQLASGKRRISPSSYNFNGFKNVERIAVDGGYKYYLSKYLTVDKAKLALTSAKKKGYPSAFIVAFNNDDTIVSANVTVPAKQERVNIKKEVIFKVQIASSANKISTAPKNFKGLKEVEAVKVGGYYKYYLGKTTDFKEAKAYLKKAKDKKYKSAFLVAILNNKRITLKEALAHQTN